MLAAIGATVSRAAGIGSFLAPKSWAQSTLPYPGSPAVLPRTNVVSFGSAATGDFPPASVARAMAQLALSGITAIAGQIQSNNRIIENLRTSLSDAEARKAQLERERPVVLADYRKGYFCSTCGRAKSEFSSEAAFWQHIAEGASDGRHAVPASAEQIAAKEADYRTKIAALDQQIQQARSQLAQKDRENRDGLDQLKEGTALWQTATEMEPQLLAVSEDAAQARDRKDLGDAQREIARLKGQRQSAAGSKEALVRIDDALAVWQQVESRTSDQSKLRYEAFLRESTAAKETAIREYAAISGQLANADPSLPSLPNLLSASLPIGPLSVNSDGSTLGAKFRFGRIVSSGINASAPDAATTEVRAFLDLAGRLRLTTGWQTRYTPDGVQNGPIFDLTVTPPNDKKPPLAPKPLPVP